MALALLCVVAGGGVFWFLHTAGSQERTFVSDSVGLAFTHSDRIEAQTLSETEKTDKKLLFRGAPKDNSIDQPYLIQCWYEDKFRLAASLTKKEPLELLLENQKNSFPKLYPQYRELSLQRTERNGRKAAEIFFTYQNTQRVIVKQRLLVVLKDDDTAVYVSAQAREADFELVNRRYFQAIFASISFR